VCDRVVILVGGRIAAAGAPKELTRGRGVAIETANGTRVIENADRDDVPRILAELVTAGEAVYEVRALRSTLEEVYLEAVEGDGP
jgi:ABC-2 type transport system ATP-binding protein